MKLGSLFAGIGGFDLAFERAGFEPAYQVEIDPACQRVLAQHWPGVPRFSDVRNVGAHNLPHADVITFGSPCQGLSVAGKRAGLADERSGLFHEAIRIIRECRPTIAIWENVPGALSSNGGRDFGAAIDALAESGALDIGWAVLDAQWFGVPQRRRRVFVVADFGGQRASEILAIPYGMSWAPAPGGAAGEAVAGTLGGGAGSRGWAPDTDRMTFVASSHGTYTGGKGTIRSSGGDAGGGSEILVARSLNAHEQRIDGESETFVVRTAQTGSNGWGVQREGNITLDGAQGQAVAFIERARNDGSNLEIQPELAYALTNPGQRGRTSSRQLYDGATVRRLTPTECARLQSFPDNWLEVDHADAAQAHAREVLCSLWRAAHTTTGEGWRSGITLALFPPEILLAGVHGGWLSWEVASRCAGAYREAAGANSWPEGFLRRLREYVTTRPSPYRREPFEQLAGELGRPLSELPFEAPQVYQAVRHSGLWPKASAQWLLRSPCAESEALGRPEHCTYQSAPLSDSTRYRQFGNAVCVPVVEWIARRLMAVL